MSSKAVIGGTTKFTNPPKHIPDVLALAAKISEIILDNIIYKIPFLMLISQCYLL